MANYVICQRWHMTYDINNIWCYGCLENHQDLSYSAPGFKVTQKVVFMPKKWKTKYEYFPLYFKEFSFIKTRFKDWICGTIKSQLSAKIKLSLYSHYPYPTFKTPPELIGEFLPFSHHPSVHTPYLYIVPICIDMFLV